MAERATPWRTVLTFALVAGIVLVASWFAVRPSAPAASDTGAGRPVVGQVAPEFSAQTTDKTAFTLASLRGKGVWLSFGATWCADCRTEATDMRDAAAAATGVATVMVFTGEDAATVTSYADKLGLGFTKVPDPSSAIAAQYRIVGIPTHYFIDAQGVVKAMSVGVLTRDQMDAALATVG